MFFKDNKITFLFKWEVDHVVHVHNSMKGNNTPSVENFVTAHNYIMLGVIFLSSYVKTREYGVEVNRMSAKYNNDKTAGFLYTKFNHCSHDVIIPTHSAHFSSGKIKPLSTNRTISKSASVDCPARTNRRLTFRHNSMSGTMFLRNIRLAILQDCNGIPFWR